MKALREQRNLSQGAIEERTGLNRVYISRVENSHTTPSIQTLEKLARALDVPMYALFYDGKSAPTEPRVQKRPDPAARQLARFYRLVGTLKDGDRTLLLFMAKKMALRKGSK